MEGKEEADRGKSRKLVAALPKYYAQVCLEMPKEYSDYRSLATIPCRCPQNRGPCSSPDKYEIIRKIGRGKYADVYEGIRIADDTKVAIKILKPGIDNRILGV